MECYFHWVFPFGDPRIDACLRLLGAYRSLPRPSSPPRAKASTVCPYLLDPRFTLVGSQYYAIVKEQSSYYAIVIGSVLPVRKTGDCAARHRSSAAFPRKEVIQPQVPLRLPCYDFTPVTSHSLGGCLTRLAHRLLEQLTPMV